MTQPHKRNILLLAAAGLRASLAEQLAHYPEFAVSPATSAEEATRLLDRGGCDILLVDATIGEAFACQAREGFRGPVLLIGAPSDPMAAQAPEYIARPFRFAHLLARLRAGAEEPERPIVVIGAYRYRPGAFELTDAADRRRSLTEKEAEILTRLVAARGAAVTKDMLLREVWGYHPTVTTRTLETHVSRLRRKIETDPTEARLLLTEKNGYRLVFSPAR
ncbi:response regulator transcription factor [Methylosinus sp. H3A]|uniref:response regulator transcription factor n=1 Tax=Methylosinus sp. H3A TaxID=2785786 RepID=UPI0018C2AB94|nr:response regulator transcription factor [Methylosinus sp. H3A]MBG0810229.1 response regulator transcription factor [Methylosinus sp. H3A]